MCNVLRDKWFNSVHLNQLSAYCTKGRRFLQLSWTFDTSIIRTIRFKYSMQWICDFERVFRPLPLLCRNQSLWSCYIYNCNSLNGQHKHLEHYTKFVIKFERYANISNRWGWWCSMVSFRRNTVLVVCWKMSTREIINDLQRVYIIPLSIA